MKDKVVAIVSKAAKIDPSILLEDSSALLWDSLTHLEIIFLLEESFDIQLDTADIASMRSLDAIMEVMQRILRCKK